MTRQLISSGSQFEHDIGYSRAVVDGEWVFVSGTTGLPNAARFPECWPILRKYLGAVRPAAMMISAGLSDPRMQIEIEVTARKRAA